MPESVEIPAPVSTTIRSAAATHPAARSIARSIPPSLADEIDFPFTDAGTPMRGADLPPHSRPIRGGPPLSIDPFPEPEPLPATVHVAPWRDPVVDRRGHDPRSAYVEQFWLGVLGPTATWLLRRLVAGFDHFPDGYDLDVGATARSLGLSVTKGTASPFNKAVQRCVMFGARATPVGLVAGPPPGAARLPAPPRPASRRPAVGPRPVDDGDDPPRRAVPRPRPRHGDARRRRRPGDCSSRS